MSTNDTFLAIFLGSKTSPRVKDWNALSDSERRAKEQEGQYSEGNNSGGVVNG